MAIFRSCGLAAAVIILLCVKLSSCGPANHGPGGARDSLGITIVDNESPRVSNTAIWSVDSSALMRIGTLDGPSATRLAGVRSATLLENGMVAISDGQSREIRVFDTSGVHVTTFGREGDGPGEFRGGVTIEAGRGDTVLAWDGSAFRRSRYSVRAGLLETEQLAYAEIFSGLSGTRPWAALLRDGSFVIAGQHSWKVPPPYFELYRLTTSVTWLSADRKTTINLATYPGPEEFLVPGTEPPNISVDFPPFRRRGVFAAGGDPPRICVGDTGVPEIRCYQIHAAPLFVRWRQEALPVELLEIDQWRNERRRTESKRGGGARQQLERVLSNAPIPKTKPYYSGLIVDDAHNLWIETSGNEAEVIGGARRFEVFSPTGEWLGRAMLPKALILEIGIAHVLAVGTTDGGFEVVTRYHLRRHGQR